MDVVFITTSAYNLSNVAVKNGQVIALRDAPGYYYDHDNTRWHVGGLVQTTTLPPLIDIVEASPAIYLLTAVDGSYSPGVYVPNELHTEWIRIAGNVIEDDVPNDSHDYVRRNQTWVEPYSVMSCTGVASDVSRINTAIADFYSSNRQYGTIKIVGELNFGSNLGLSLLASNPDQSLTLDFSAATVTADDPYSGCMFEISYRGSASHAGGKVQIIGLDTTAVCGFIFDIYTIQQVELIRCALQHGYGAYGTTSTIVVSSASPFKLIDSSVMFVDTTTATTKPFMKSEFEMIPIIITGNTFRFTDPSNNLTEIIVDFLDPWSSYCVFEDNVIVGSLIVRTDVNNTPVVMNTSLNNTVLSEV
jgi:hypothetical protein